MRRTGIILLCILLLAAAMGAFTVSALRNAGPEQVLSAWNGEANDILALGTPTKSDDDGYYAAGVSLVPGGANGSSYAMLISGAGNGNGQTVTGLKAQTAYEITFWAKVLCRDKTAYPNVGVNAYDGGAYQAIDSFTGDWAQYTLEFTTGSNSTSAVFYTWIFGSGSAELWLDDVKLTEKNHTHSYVNGACDCGAADPDVTVLADLKSKAQLVTFEEVPHLQLQYPAEDLADFRNYNLRIFAQTYDPASGDTVSSVKEVFPLGTTPDGEYILFDIAVTDITHLNDALTVQIAGQKQTGFCIGASENICVSDLLYDRLDASAVENGSAEKITAYRRLLTETLLYAAAEQQVCGYPAENRADSRMTQTQRSWAGTSSGEEAYYAAVNEMNKFTDDTAAKQRTYDGITYHGAVTDTSFALLYNTLGYEASGTKKAFVRSLDYVYPGYVGDAWWRLTDADDNVLAQGNLVYRGLSYGLQLWEADFSEVDTVQTCRLTVEVHDINENGYFREISSDFRIQEHLYSGNVLLPLTLYNAQAREAPANVGGGFYDCNTTMGEAYSHGVFLNGLVQTYVSQYDSLSDAERTGLASEAARAFDYLVLLHDDSTGEFIHSDPRRYNADANPGFNNTYEALYGFAAYLYHFKGIDTVRCNDANYQRAVQSLQYLRMQFSGNNEYPYNEYLIPVCYYLYKYSGDTQWLTLGTRLIDSELSSFNLRTNCRSGARTIPMFEGIYLFLTDGMELTERQTWLTKLAQIRDTYYVQVQQGSAMDIFPVSGKLNAAAEWDAMWQMPAGEYERAWQLTTGRAANALDACFLGILLEDPSMEQIATGSLGYVMGLNPGISGSLTENPGSARQIAAAALVQNLNGRRARGWSWWEFTPKNDRWMSIMNGFCMADGNYCFADSTNEDWVYGETFIRHDGVYAYAFCVYEQFLDSIS